LIGRGLGRALIKIADPAERVTLVAELLPIGMGQLGALEIL
jgi:hypothetical protein